MKIPLLCQKISLSRAKLLEFYSYYSEKREFLSDKLRKSESPKRKMKPKYTDAILELLWEDSDLKIPQMVNFLKKIDVSRTTIRKAITESDYNFIGLIINKAKKYSEGKEKETWLEYETNITQERTNVFFSIETRYLENFRGFKWVHKDEQNIYQVRRIRGKNLNIWGTQFMDKNFN